jgi:hypothetical protein
MLGSGARRACLTVATWSILMFNRAVIKTSQSDKQEVMSHE